MEFYHYHDSMVNLKNYEILFYHISKNRSMDSRHLLHIFDY
uniref:Uncharacterized protein n=1 Tax=viral metagenome TaxID=1070528 RepID=A0A6C0H9G3_9ZZZZ